MNIKIIDKYIAKQIIGTILIVALALLGLDIFFNLGNELKYVGRGNFTLNQALLYIFLTSPNRLYAMFPWAALLGTLICLGALASHRELVVMRTSSISVMRICYSVVKAALLLIVFVVIIGEVIAPKSERLAHSKKTLAISKGQSIETAYGIWVRQGHNFIHIKYLQSNNELIGVTRYQFDDKRNLKEVSFAENAVQVDNGWRLTNITGTRFEPNKTSVIALKEQIIPKLLEKEVLETARVKHPERLSLTTLWRIIHYRLKNELNAKNYELAFWNKIFQPLLIILMVILAVPFVFGPLRSVSMGFRIVAGIFVAYVFHTINAMFAPLAIVYQIPPLIAVLIPMCFFAALGYLLLKRVR